MKLSLLTMPVLLGTVLLTGCSTTTTMTYDLNAPTQAATTQMRAIDYQLASVEVPDNIDVATLIVRQPDNSLMVLSHDKWAGTLGEAFRSGLTTALTQNMGLPPLPNSMKRPQKSGSGDFATVAVKIEQFDMQPARQASLGVLWQVDFDGKQRKSVTCYTTLATPVDPGVAALVSAQQRNVQKLGELIATTLQTGTAPADIKCRTANLK